MKKILFGIFAHPDDEAFGAAATLLKEASEGTEIRLVCLTDGNGKHSVNPDNVSDLGQTRLAEWNAAAKLLGATTQHHMGYKDGTLSNDIHIEIVEGIEKIVRETVAEHPDVHVEFLSFDLSGLTGHIDHIVASRSTLLAFYRLKEAGVPVTRTRLICLSRSDFPHMNTHFVLWERGVSEDDIDETVDMRHEVDKIYEIMRTHHTQQSDADFWIQKLGDRVAINHLVIKD